MIASTPQPPYYTVIFSSEASDDTTGYGKMAARMVALAQAQRGFLGIETLNDTAGFGITVSYWEDEAAIRSWKRNAEHLRAQAQGQELWYARYFLRVAKVERAYSFSKHDQALEV